MKVKYLPIMAGILLLAGSPLLAQLPSTSPTPAPGLPPNSSTTTTVNCPGSDPDCAGDCIFTVSVISEAGDSCEDNRVDVTFQANSTGDDCVADFNRSSEGEISFTLCDGEECEIDDSHFPDDSFWPPYVEGDGQTKPPGKDSISQACFDAIEIRTQGSGPPYALHTYRFTGVSDVDPDFGIETQCYCDGDTIFDTIIVQVSVTTAELIEGSGRGGENGVVGHKNGPKGEGGAFADAATFSVSNIYPNPTSNELNVVLHSFVDSHVKIIIHNQVGQRVRQSIKMLAKGDNLFTLDVRELKNGFYYMTVIDSLGDKVVMKFIHT